MLKKFWNRAALAAVVTVLSVSQAAVAQTTLLSEDFEGLSLMDATSPTETAAPGVWTNVPPAGWNRDNTTTPLGNPVEFQGWTFLNKEWWIGSAGDQDRSSFTAGQGVVAVADPDEYDDGTDIDTGNFDVFLSTPAINLSGVAANTVRVKFDSNFRAEVTQIGQLDVSFDGTNYSNILEYDSNVLVDGQTYNDAVDIAVNNPTGGSMWLRWGLIEGSNDWWWAVDNINVSGRQVPEPASFTLVTLAGLTLLGFRRRTR